MVAMMAPLRRRDAVSDRLADFVLEAGAPYGLPTGGETRLATS